MKKFISDIKIEYEVVRQLDESDFQNPISKLKRQIQTNQKSLDDIIKQRKSTYAKADVKIKVYKTNKENIANKIIKLL